MPVSGRFDLIQASCLRSVCLALCLVVSLAALPEGQAAGFAVGDQGAASSGLAGAATGRTDLPEAGFYNPAGWAFHEGLQLRVGGSAVMGAITHRDPESGATTDALTETGTPPHVHAAYSTGTLAFGVSALVPFGSGLGWPDDWAGRFEITKIGLRAYEIGANVAWRPVDNFAIAAGPRLLSATVEYERMVDVADPDNEAHVRLGAASNGVGGQLSMVYRPIGELTLGLAWRSRVQFDFEGAAHFEDIPIELSQKAHDTRAKTTLVLPDRIALGAAYELPFGVASLDFELMTWSTFETFAVEFESPDVPDISEPRLWRNTVTVRAGFEYRDLLDELALRVGLAYDPTPSPDDTLSPSLPDGDRVVLTLGAGYTFDFGLGLDLAYGRIIFTDTMASYPAFPGSYDTAIDVLSVGISYR